MTLCSAGLLTVSIYDLSESLLTNYSVAPQNADIKGPRNPGPLRSAPLVRSLSDSLGALKVAVWVEHKLLGRALVEVLVALRSLIERDDRGVDGPGDLGPVVEDRHHQLPVVLHDRALAGVERVALGPAEPDADLERPLLGLGVRGARVAGDVEARDAHSAAGARDAHDGVEDRRRSLDCVRSVRARLEAYGVHRTVHLGFAHDLGDLVTKLRSFRDVYGL